MQVGVKHAGFKGRLWPEFKVLLANSMPLVAACNAVCSQIVTGVGETCLEEVRAHSVGSPTGERHGHLTAAGLMRRAFINGNFMDSSLTES